MEEIELLYSLDVTQARAEKELSPGKFWPQRFVGFGTKLMFRTSKQCFQEALTADEKRQLPHSEKLATFSTKCTSK